MMRLKKFLIIAIGSILAIGCAKDDLPRTEEEGVKTYLKVHIPRSEIRSRTVGYPTTPGTQEENAIADATVYLTNDERIVKIENILMQQNTDSYVSDLIPVEVDLLDQEFQVFVVANPDKSDLSIRTTQDFKEAYSTREETYKLVTLGQMVMSNQVEQSPAPTITITKENTKDNPAKVFIRLDRLAVKIEPQVSVDFTANFSNHPKEEAFFEDYTFSVEAAGLLNAATEFNLEQQWSIGTTGNPIQLLSPTWYYQPEESYFSRYYRTISEYADMDTSPFVSFGESIEGGYRLISSPFYCLENNSPFYDYAGSNIAPENQIETKYKGLTTGVIFKMQALKDGKVADFYRYEGKYYADTELDKQALAIAAGLNSGDFENTFLLRAKGINVYEDGCIYYTYWIKDKNPLYSGDDYNLSYSVIRNSYYILRVNALTRIGDDIPGGGYDPEEPIDKVVQLEIVAVCQDWTLVDVTHDFN